MDEQLTKKTNEPSNAFKTCMWVIGLPFVLSGLWGIFESIASETTSNNLITSSIALVLGGVALPPTWRLFRRRVVSSVTDLPERPAPHNEAGNPRLVPCKSCRQSVARTANKCPHCGQGNPGVPAWAYWATALVLLGLPVACIMDVASTPPRVIDANTDLSAAGYRYCKSAISYDLRSPSTAKFSEDYSYWKVPGQQIYTVKSNLDAQNAFGAMLRTGWRCKIQFVGQNEYLQQDWQVLEKTIDPQ